MTKKDLVNWLKNLRDEELPGEDKNELARAELMSFLKLLDKHELKEFADVLKQIQIPELRETAREVAAIVHQIAAEKEEVH
jgi:hypothetical protein